MIVALVCQGCSQRGDAAGDADCHAGRCAGQPGEEIRTPLIALLFWKGGDVVESKNLWRRWYRAQNIPRVGGEPQPAVAQIQVGGSEKDIAYVQKFLDAGILVDLCWRDAGGTREGVWFKVAPDPLPFQHPGMIWLNSGTWEIDPGLDGMTDLQAGSYLFMDVNYRNVAGRSGPVFDDFRPALFVLATAISQPAAGMITIDAGYKAFATD